MNRRSFFGKVLGAVAAPVVAAFGLAKAAKKPPPKTNWKNYTYTYANVDYKEFEAALHRALKATNWNPLVSCHQSTTV